jgi:hypothetical protein
MHLAPATRRWANKVARDFELEPHHLMLLEGAGAAWDRAKAAGAVIAQEGLTFTDQNGHPRARPEVAIERDARTLFARLLRELALDVTAPDEPRPPGLATGWRRAT